ncbi:MAG: TatD family hydrolase [Bacteroidales bacterium]|nr:TatD family hydrolase [Bacteroidales bacterium]
MLNDFTDTHAHLYLKAFRNDIAQVMERASKKGIERVLLPNIDRSTIDDMHRLCAQYPGVCFPMMGLHPTSVKEDFRKELDAAYEHLNSNDYVAIGETGIDLYRDKTFVREQKESFKIQLQWAKKLDLPVVIHARESFEEIFDVLDEEFTPGLKGVFHSFTGSSEHVKKILSYGFLIGINGIVTFKNSGLSETVKKIPKDHILIETDAPYLAPTPFRGKRNESSYLTEVAARLADIYNLGIEDIADVTTKNARELFKHAF